MKGIKGSNGPGLEKGAPGGKITRKQVGPVDQAHLPSLPCSSAWPELGSPDLEPQEAASNSAREASSLVLNTWAQLCPLDAEAKHEPGLHHETGSSLGDSTPILFLPRLFFSCSFLFNALQSLPRKNQYLTMNRPSFQTAIPPPWFCFTDRGPSPVCHGAIGSEVSLLTREKASLREAR